MFSAGWTRWRKRGELPLLPEALHGAVAERSEVHSDHCRHEEVSSPPAAQTLPEHLVVGTFTQNSIKSSHEREIEKFLSVIRATSHFSHCCVATKHRLGREAPVKPTCTKSSVSLSNKHFL